MILSILSGLDQIPEADIVDVSDEEVLPGEEVKGIAGLQIRRLYTALYRQAEITRHESKELRASANFGDLRAKLERIKRGMNRAELLKKILWQEVREEFDIWGRDVAIKKGWQIVAIPTEPEVRERVSSLRVVTIGENCENCDDVGCPSHPANNRSLGASFAQPPGRA